ncbi:MAG: tetratricopeptide repeat protein, partial [Candidatus Helarchaeota archaeon]
PSCNGAGKIKCESCDGVGFTGRCSSCDGNKIDEKATEELKKSLKIELDTFANNVKLSENLFQQIDMNIKDKIEMLQKIENLDSAKDGIKYALKIQEKKQFITIKNLINRAIAEIKADNFIKAWIFLDKSLLLKETADAWNLLAFNEFKREDYYNMEKFIKKAEKIDTTEESSNFTSELKALLHFKNSNYLESFIDITNSTRNRGSKVSFDLHEPYLSETLFKLSEYFMTKQEYQKAEEILNYLLLINPNSVPALFILGNIAFFEFSFIQAISKYKEAIRKDPNYQPAQNALNRKDISFIETYFEKWKEKAKYMTEKSMKKFNKAFLQDFKEEIKQAQKNMDYDTALSRYALLLEIYKEINAEKDYFKILDEMFECYKNRGKELLEKAKEFFENNNLKHAFELTNSAIYQYKLSHDKGKIKSALKFLSKLKKKIAENETFKAESKMVDGKFKEALEYYLKAKEYLLDIGESSFYEKNIKDNIRKCSNKVADEFFSKVSEIIETEKRLTVIPLLNDIIKEFESHENFHQIKIARDKINEIYQNQGEEVYKDAIESLNDENFEEAEEFFMNSLYWFQKCEDKEAVSRVIKGIDEIYIKLGDNEIEIAKSLNEELNFEDSESKLKSAINFFSKRNLSEKIEEAKKLIIYNLRDYGLTFQKKGEEAFNAENFEKAIELFEHTLLIFLSDSIRKYKQIISSPDFDKAEFITSANQNKLLENEFKEINKLIVKAKNGKANLQFKTAMSLLESKEYTKAINLFEIAKDLYQKIQNNEALEKCKKQVLACYNGIGLELLKKAKMKKEQKNYDEAILSFKEAQDYFIKAGNSEFIKDSMELERRSWNDWGESYLDKAKGLQKKFLTSDAEVQLDKALHCLIKAKVDYANDMISNLKSKFWSQYSLHFSKEAEIFNKEKDYLSAAQAWERSLIGLKKSIDPYKYSEIAKKMKNNYEKFANEKEKEAKNLVKIKNFDDAIKVFSQALEFYKKADSEKYLKVQETIVETWEKFGDYCYNGAKELKSNSKIEEAKNQLIEAKEYYIKANHRKKVRKIEKEIDKLSKIE